MTEGRSISDSGCSTAPRPGSGIESFRERVHRGRAAQGCLVKVLGAFVLVGGLLCLRGPEKPLGVMLVVGSLSLALYGAGKTALSRRITQSVVKSRGLWRLVYLVPVVAGCDCSWRWRSGAQVASCSAGVRIPIAE